MVVDVSQPFRCITAHDAVALIRRISQDIANMLSIMRSHSPPSSSRTKSFHEVRNQVSMGRKVKKNNGNYVSRTRSHPNHSS